MDFVAVHGPEQPASGNTVLLSLVMPEDVAERVEDLLLDHPHLVRGFTTSYGDGHGLGVELAEPSELVAGHAPRVAIRTVGPEPDLLAMLAILKQAFPGANVFYWLVPVLQAGHL